MFWAEAAILGTELSCYRKPHNGSRKRENYSHIAWQCYSKVKRCTLDNLVDEFQHFSRVQCRGFESHRDYSFFLGVSCVSLLCLDTSHADRQTDRQTGAYQDQVSWLDMLLQRQTDTGFSTFPLVVVGGSCRSLWGTSGEWEGLGAAGATDDRIPSLSSTTE